MNKWDSTVEMKKLAETGFQRDQEESMGSQKGNFRYLTWGYYTFTNKTKINYVWKAKVREVFASS